MRTYIIRRLLILIPMLIVISFLIYLGIELMPGDAVSFMIGPEAAANIPIERLDEIRESLGLNDPFIVRYFRWLGGIIRGDFGYSLTSGVPISEIVFSRLSATIELAVAALIFSTVLGSILGILSALKRGGILDNVVTVAGMVGLSLPQFFFGLVAIVVFSLNLGWLPAGGRIMPGYETFFDRLPHLILPAIVLGSSLTAGVMRYSRNSMLESLNKDFIKTARSKGLPEWRINLIHGFRVAMTPVVVLVGFRLPMLVGGTVVIEEIFQWPGMGREFLAAVRGQDLPLIMMIALFTVTAVLFASFLIDILTAIIDPRVRLE
ncbi:peptide ABC transporter permease [Petrotoga sp. HKA.pet.4.5]|uniref:ABC transporter permease n=1 Tax=unclassified Petrotoga TaxID=2620614 RepID=UPI000EF13DF4|nr:MULTISPECIES: ABC transporter permease [unclassified Petrotoga]RLL82363.1 peptide ABC transporter permease [Petrotoga sp. Shatin.DS.tank11.9.2.9.3]RLL90062.1 peptide ABC transporter permease [Petrotoga sp. HKA.pet.4.5]